MYLPYNLEKVIRPLKKESSSGETPSEAELRMAKNEAIATEKFVISLINNHALSGATVTE